jgi:hypothetical protein
LHFFNDVFYHFVYLNFPIITNTYCLYICFWVLCFHLCIWIGCGCLRIFCFAKCQLMFMKEKSKRSNAHRNVVNTFYILKTINVWNCILKSSQIWIFKNLCILFFMNLQSLMWKEHVYAPIFLLQCFISLKKHHIELYLLICDYNMKRFEEILIFLLIPFDKSWH